MIANSYCNPSTRACSQQPVPSGRARQRRNQIALSKAQCPPQHEACSLVGYFGYECIDTMVSLHLTRAVDEVQADCFVLWFSRSRSRTSSDAEAVMEGIALNFLELIVSTARRDRASSCESLSLVRRTPRKTNTDASRSRC